ncbi:PilZ domain-containing protein [Acidobacteria bacterium AH-259-D05]|nr:PilZ domain-containing protein [Acidobacteria bacterium AH-259-D05]
MHLSLYQVDLSVRDIDQAEAFYSQLLAMPGRRVSPGRHYFDCGGMVLCCQDLRGEGDSSGEGNSSDVSVTSHQLCFVVGDLEAVFERAKNANCNSLDEQIVTQPWGTRSFVAEDPFENSILFVDEATMQKQVGEQSAVGPSDRLKVGFAFAISSTEGESENRLVASVAKIFRDELWLKLADSLPDPFKEGDQVHIEYFDESGGFLADAKIVKISPSENEYVAISIPQNAQVVQRRGAPRVHSVMPVSFSAFDSPESQEVLEEVFDAQSRDISTGGMRIETEAQLKEEDKVLLKLALSRSATITVVAQVKRCQQVEVEGKTKALVGMKFVEMQLDDQIQLLQFLIGGERDEESAAEEVESKEEEEAPAAQEVEGKAQEEAPAEQVRSEEEKKTELPAIVRAIAAIASGKAFLELRSNLQEAVTLKSVFASSGGGSLIPLLDGPKQLSPGQIVLVEVTEKLLTLFDPEVPEAQETHIHVLLMLEPEPPDQPSPSSYIVRFEAGNFTEFSEEE